MMVINTMVLAICAIAGPMAKAIDTYMDTVSRILAYGAQDNTDKMYAASFVAIWFAFAIKLMTII